MVRLTPKLGLAAASVAALAALVAVVGITTSGDDPTPSASVPSPPPAVAQPASQTQAALSPTARRGKKIFTSAGCGGCHTLAAAGTTGTAGPDLDLRQPTKDRIVRQVRRGGPGMPSFRGRLKDKQIADVAAFVAASTGVAGGNKPILQPFVPDGTRIEDCTTDQACFQRAFGNLAYNDGPKPTLELFAQKMATDKTVEAGCHRIAHMIGAGALAGLDNKPGIAIAQGQATCWSGYYHGVLERSYAGVTNARLGSVTRGLCVGKEVQATTFIYYQCVHGLGHGLMIHTGYDLPMSLKTCDKLNTDWDRSSCTGGVFMENISSSYGVKSKWLKDADLLFPCNAVAERHKLYCYLMVTSRILEATGFHWNRAASECRRAEKNWIATCFQSFGRDASGNTRQDPAGIVGHCATTGDMEGECIYGAARDVTSNDAGGTRAAVMCERASVTHRPRCYEGIGTIIGSLHSTAEGRQAACKELSSQYLADCARGSGAPIAPPPDSAKPAP
jgi:mono/diheme cytochrome c family protein